MLQYFQIIKDRLRANGYNYLQYLPSRPSLAIGQELHVFKSFFYKKIPCLFNSSCFYSQYHFIFRRNNPYLYRLYDVFFMNGPVDENFLLTLFNQEEVNNFIDNLILKAEGGVYKFNFRFIPYEDLFLIGKVDMEDREYVHLGYDSVTFAEALRGMLTGRKVRRALEIGCGAGLISIELAKYAECVAATDINPYAVRAMEINARLNNIFNNNAFISDIYNNVKGKYDLIVADPPFEIMSEHKKEILHRYGGHLGQEIAIRILNGLDEFLDKHGEAVIFTNSYIKNFRQNTLKDNVYKMFKDKKFKVVFSELSYQINPDFYSDYRRHNITHSISYIIHIKRSPGFEMKVVRLNPIERVKETSRVIYLYGLILLQGIRNVFRNLPSAVKDFFVDVISIIVFLTKEIFKVLNPSKRNQKEVRIILYHSIAFDNRFMEINVKPDLFERQLIYLQDNSYDIISLEEFYEYYSEKKPLKKKSVVITFDDGFKNIYENAYPILKKIGMKAGLFLPCNFMNRNDLSLWSKNRCFLAPLTWDEVNAMKDVFDIGSHSITHRNLTLFTDAQLEKEVKDSKRIINEKTGSTVDFFAYPYGFYGFFDARTEEFLKATGYKLAFLNISGVNCRDGNYFKIKRTRISSRDSLWRFKLKIVGGYDWLDKMKFFLKQ